MYNEEYFYGLFDLLHFNVYASLFKDLIDKEERVIIKVFRREDEIVVIETNNFVDTILKDTRKDKNSDLMIYDLVFLKTLERYYMDYQMKGMVYEYIEGVGAWYRVRVEGHKPLDMIYKPFYLKKKVEKDELGKYVKTDEELKKLEEFYDLTKGIVKFTKPKKVRELLEVIEK